jgi:hypothetical protein
LQYASSAGWKLKRIRDTMQQIAAAAIQQQQPQPATDAIITGRHR